MTPIQIALVVIASVVVTLVGMYLVIPFAIKKGINITNILSTAQTALDTAETVVDGLQLIMPENTAISTVDLIVSYAKKAADAAEQMFKAQQIQDAERKETAIGIVNTCLSIAGIERTADIDKAVDSMIEAAVLGLPKTNLQDAKKKK